MKYSKMFVIVGLAFSSFAFAKAKIISGDEAANIIQQGMILDAETKDGLKGVSDNGKCVLKTTRDGDGEYIMKIYNNAGKLLASDSLETEEDVTYKKEFKGPGGIYVQVFKHRSRMIRYTQYEDLSDFKIELMTKSGRSTSCKVSE